MSDSPKGPSEIDPDEAGRREFTKARRGFDPNEVRAHLLAVTSELKRAKAEALEASRRADRLEKSLSEKDSLDPSTVTKVLGEETTRVLESARGAAEEISKRAQAEADALVASATERAGLLQSDAEEIRAKAAKDSDELVASARTQSEQLLEESRAAAEERRRDAEEAAQMMRAEASTVLESRTAEANVEADAIREAAFALKKTTEEEVAQLRSEAAAEVAALRETTEAQAQAKSEELIEAARDRGRTMIAEAKEARERMLRDLAEKRKVSRKQLEAMRAGRERLLESFSAARTSLDSVTEDLVDSLPAARAAANAAAQSVTDDIDAAVKELDAEIGSGADITGEFDDDLAETTLLGDAGDLVEKLPAEPVEGDRSHPVDAKLAASLAPDANDADLAVSSATDTDVADADVAGADEAVADDAADVSATIHSDVADSGSAGSEVPDSDVANLASSDDSAPVDSVADGEVADETDDEEELAQADDAVVIKSGEEAKSHLRLIPNHSDPDDDLDEFLAEDEAAEGHDLGLGDADRPVAPVDDLFARLRADADDNDDDGEADASVFGVEPDDAITVSATAEGGVVLDLVSASTQTQSGASAAHENVGTVLTEDGSDTADESQKVLDERDAFLERAVVDLNRKLKRVLSDQENHLLDRVRRERKLETPEELLPGLDESREEMESAIAHGLAEVLDAAIAFLEGRGIAPKTIDSSKLLLSLSSHREAVLFGAIRSRLVEAIERTDDDSRDRVELVAKLRGTYREWRNEQLAQAMGDVATTVFNSAIIGAVPDGTHLQWIVDNGGLPCPDAEDNHLEGPIAAGDKFPTGDVCPSAHPGCRCLLVPRDS